MEHLRTIVEATLVPHTAFTKASARLAQCLRYAENASEPICIAVTGESRTGKSRVLEECIAAHFPQRTKEGVIKPILYVKTPPRPTVKGLAEEMLRAIGDPKSSAGEERSKTSRLKTLMAAAKIKMVILDEFQHFHDKGSRKIMHEVADWLKILVDDMKVALVVAGLPRCRAVLNQNEQLDGRFLAPAVMPQFDWRDDDARDEFVGILEAFHESLGRHFDLPPLHSPGMAFRCYCGTGGLIGYLTKFLRQAVWDAIDEGRTSIDLAQLYAAHRGAVWVEAGAISFPNPFSKSFTYQPSEDLIARVQQIGVPPPEALEALRAVQRRRSAKSRQTTLAAT